MDEPATKFTPALDRTFNDMKQDVLRAYTLWQELLAAGETPEFNFAFMQRMDSRAVDPDRRVTLTGSQVTRVFEALSRYDDNLDTNGMQITVEDLVNDILDVVRVG